MDYWNNIDYFKKHNKLYRKSKMGKAFERLYCYKRMDEKNGFGDVIDFDARWIVENIFSKTCVHCGETDWTKLGCNRICVFPSVNQACLPLHEKLLHQPPAVGENQRHPDALGCAVAIEDVK